MQYVFRFDSGYKPICIGSLEQMGMSSISEFCSVYRNLFDEGEVADGITLICGINGERLYISNSEEAMYQYAEEVNQALYDELNRPSDVPDEQDR